jgi:hypothetical protein
MRRAAVVSAVAAMSAVVSVSAANAAPEELSGSCSADGFRGSAKMVYVQDGEVYRPMRITAGTGPHLGDSEPSSASARLRITHVVAGSIAEVVDFDKTRPRLKTGVPVSEPVSDVEIPVSAKPKLKVTFSFVKPGGDKASCSVVKDVSPASR